MPKPAAAVRALDSVPIYVLGAGGHAAVVLDTLRAMGRVCAGTAEIGDEAALLAKAPDSLVLANGLGGVGDTAPRRLVFERFKARGFRFMTLVHPGAIVAPSAVLDEGAQIMAGAVVQPEARIGANTIINTRAVVDHHCTVGAHCHIASGATLASAVAVGEGAHVGAGATVIQRIKIGAGALIGAGAAVVRDVPSGAVAMGVPARIRKPQR
jgi:sugar O-acyltransferase (sialic acid O-acetyltransferase NeuD family)